MPELGLMDTLRAMGEMNRQSGQRVQGFQALNPNDPEAAFIDAMNARNYSPKDLNLRDAEHYLYMHQAPVTQGSSWSEGNRFVQPVMGMNAAATLMPLLYSLMKLGQQNYGVPEFNVPAAGVGPFDYKHSTPPD